MVCNLVKSKHFNISHTVIDTMNLLKTDVEVKNIVNKHREATKRKYLNFKSCELAHDVVDCFCNFCVTDKEAKTYHKRGQIS